MDYLMKQNYIIMTTFIKFSARSFIDLDAMLCVVVVMVMILPSEREIMHNAAGYLFTDIHVLCNTLGYEYETTE